MKKTTILLIAFMYVSFIMILPIYATSLDAKSKISVLPSSFSPESIRNYPEWVKQMQSAGYGNAIWHELEDILYETTDFQLVMEPPTAMEEFRHILAAKKTQGNEGLLNVELPDQVLTINVNFFVRTSETIRGFASTTTDSFHATVHLRYYDLDMGVINLAIPATGDAVDPDLLQATRMATRSAAEKLLKRIGKL